MAGIAFHIREQSSGPSRAAALISDPSSSISGPGNFSKLAEETICEITGAKAAYLTPSGTAALEMAALMSNITSGQEVLIPAWTFSSTVNAFRIFGADIVLADIEEETLNISVDQVREQISSKTRAIVPIHYAGIAADMQSLSLIRKETGIELIEDAAHAVQAESATGKIGSIGRFSALSFHATKNLQCGEGGALLINNEEDRQRAEIIREKGTNRRLFQNGLVDKYSWYDIGSSYVISEILAAVLVDNSLVFEHTQARRKAIWQKYEGSLNYWAKSLAIRIPPKENLFEFAYHTYWLGFPNETMADKFISHMKFNQIDVRKHYVNLGSAPAARSAVLNSRKKFPVSEWASHCVVRLPLYSSLTNEQVETIILNIKEFQE